MRKRVEIPRRDNVINPLCLSLTLYDPSSDQTIRCADYYKTRLETMEEPEIVEISKGHFLCKFWHFINSPYSDLNKYFENRGYKITGSTPYTGYCDLFLKKIDGKGE